VNTLAIYRSHSERTWRAHILLALLLGSALIIGLISQLSSIDPTVPSVVWGGALLFGGLAVAFFGEREFDMFSPLFFFGISFALQYGIALMLPFIADFQGPYGIKVRSVVGYYPVAGLASFMALAGFYVGYSSEWIRRNPSLAMCWQAGAMGLKVLWAMLIAVGSAAFVILLVSGVYFQVTTDVETPLFYSAVGFIQSGIFIAVPLAVGMALETKEIYWRNAAIFSVAVLLFFGIPSGSKTLMLLALVFVAIAWNYASNPFSRKQAAAALTATIGLYLLLSPFNAMYRDSISRIEDKDRTILIGLTEIQTTLKDFMAADPEELLDLTLDYSGSRLSNISVVASVLQYQDQGGPLHLGETYARAVYGLIPRFVWPDKPALAMGGEFAVELGYGAAEIQRLGKDSSLSSVGITFVGEQVYNFGLMTFFTSMAFGAFFRWIYVSFRIGLRTSQVALGIYGFLWYSLIFSAHEANFAGILAGAVKVLIVLTILFVILRFKKRPFATEPLAR
jgi:hypothetical protein